MAFNETSRAGGANPICWVAFGSVEEPKICSMTSTSRMANKESICCFPYCQAGLEGSENTDVVSYRDGLLMGAVVTVLQAFPCDLGFGLVSQPLWREGRPHFPLLSNKGQDQRAVTRS